MIRRVQGCMFVYVRAWHHFLQVPGTLTRITDRVISSSRFKAWKAKSKDSSMLVLGTFSSSINLNFWALNF
jgi:hypothetical protein